jgi:hypothetical protein
MVLKPVSILAKSAFWEAGWNKHENSPADKNHNCWQKPAEFATQW